jgi:hypothetical protein
MAFKKFVGIILILAGGYLCYVGNQQRNSLVGGLQVASVNVANGIDGKGRVADSTWYFVGGGALIVAGALSLVRRGGG